LVKGGIAQATLKLFCLGSVTLSALKIFYALQMKQCELLLMPFYNSLQLAYNIHSFKLCMNHRITE